MHEQRFFGRFGGVVMAICAVIGLGPQRLLAQDGKGPPSKAKVYVHPHKLSATDKLAFGPGKEAKETIPIKGPTALIYVDLAPDARFAHGTQCILIGADGARVIKGDWWLMLNGEPLFRDGKDFKVDFPIKLTAQAQVYVHAKTLSAKDRLAFGPAKEPKETIAIKGETMLVYVDLAASAKFAHPTQCVLISREGAGVVKGNWWLTLNGEALFRDAKDFNVGFPIELTGGDKKPAADGDKEPPAAAAPFEAKDARAHQEAWAKHFGTEVFTTNKVGMKLALVPPGEFIMGSHSGEPERGRDETQHKVRLSKAFAISVHEVTVGQFREFVKETGYQTAAEIKKEKKTWKNALPGQEETWPVVKVTWNDAVEFCSWLTKKEGRDYRLPTEAEWEYACRAGTRAAFHYGDRLTSDLANFNGNFPHPFGEGKIGPAHGQPTPVGSFAANAFGLFDMHGNVWEYCADWYGDYPKEATDPSGPANGADRVVRGGCYDAFGRNCRSADREGIAPDDMSTRTGFRVVRVFTSK